MLSNNSSKASTFFKTKKEYEELYPVFPKNKIYDIWYKRPYYGKVDTNGITVYPREKYLKNIDTRGKFRAINFVTDAFLNLQNFIRRAKSKKAFSADFLGKFNPKRSWESLPVLYDEYFENFIFNPFLNDYLANKTIPSFKCFIKEYLNYARLVSKDVSLTQSEFILSNNCTNKISGLIIDLTKEEHDDTDIKVENYLNKFEYSNFVNICKGHGFRVNKNAPWQLIADLSSGKMQIYAAKYNINLEDNNFFDLCYYRAIDIDYKNFKSYMWQMYSSYYAVNTTYSKNIVKLKSVQYGSPMFSDFETIEIKELPVEMPGDKSGFISKYGESYFLKLYLKIKLIENNIEDKYNEFEKHLIDYYRIDGLDLALRYVNKKIMNSKIYKTRNLNPYFFNFDKEK